MTGWMRRRSPRATSDAPSSSEAGTTMAETLVVVVILGIVLAMVQGTVILANRTGNESAGRVESTGNARVAIDSVTKNLRTAVLPELIAGDCSTCPTVAFVQGTPTSVQFYANNNYDQTRLGPSKVTYSLSGGVLNETIQKPDPHLPSVNSYTYCTPGPTCRVTSRVLARGVDATRIFTYYDRAGAALNGSTLTSSQLAAVDSIDVVIPIRARGEKTTLVQRVTLPNADAIAEATATP